MLLFLIFVSIEDSNLVKIKPDPDHCLPLFLSILGLRYIEVSWVAKSRVQTAGIPITFWHLSKFFVDTQPVRAMKPDSDCVISVLRRPLKLA